MKLAICCNHSFPQCGGSEIVISKIAEFLIGQGNYNVSIFSTNVKKIFTHRGVRYEPLARNFPTFAKQINNGNFDRMFVYSDYFIYWSHMVMNPKVFSCKISIALVGMNQMLLKRHILAAFRKNSEKFQTITHSDDYQDFKECQRIQVPVHVVPNGVDLDEFDHAEYIPGYCALPISFLARDMSIFLKSFPVCERNTINHSV
jgi:glycosyltransferase involved in cell wall biosynthesis